MLVLKWLRSDSGSHTICSAVTKIIVSIARLQSADTETKCLFHFQKGDWCILLWTKCSITCSSQNVKSTQQPGHWCQILLQQGELLNINEK